MAGEQRSVLPPDAKYNSRGEPYNPTPLTPQERANERASMEALRTQGWGPAKPTTPTTGSNSGVIQSEPTPQRKPPIDPRPYAWFAKNDPVIKGWIDNAAQVTGVSRERLAAHKWAESRTGRTSPRGAAGEIGIMQFMPATWKMVDPKGELDPNDGQQAMYLAGTYINQLDSRHGKDSPLSIARYNGSGPKARAYARRILGESVPDSMFNEEPSRVNLRDAVQAGKEGGPDGFLRYTVQAAPRSLTMSDKWRHVEGLLVQAMIRKGDIKGAQAARDFVMQMAFTGTNQQLMAAHRALSSGDGVRAAQHLAKSHAFFPDGTVGEFKSDGKNVFATRVDEDDPSLSMGQAPITADTIAGMLNQTNDPQQFLKTVREQQEHTANLRYKQIHGDYFAQMMQLKPQEMALDFAAKRQAEQGRQQRHQEKQALEQVKLDQQKQLFEAGQDRIDNRTLLKAAGTGNNAALDKSLADIYDPERATDRSPTGLSDFGREAHIARILAQNGTDLTNARLIAQRVNKGEYAFAMSKSGKASVIDVETKKPIAYIAPTLIPQIAGPINVQPRPTPTLGGAVARPQAGPAAAAPQQQSAIPGLGGATSRPQSQAALPGFGGASASYGVPSVDDEDDE